MPGGECFIDFVGWTPRLTAYFKCIDHAQSLYYIIASEWYSLEGALKSPE